MKKTITLLSLLLLLVAIPAQSQPKLFRSYLIRSGPYNQYTEQYDLKETRTELLITVENSVIRVRDDAHSTYITRNPRLEEDSQTTKAVSWEAVDEEGRDIRLALIEHRDTGRWSLLLVYRDYMIQYFITRAE